MTEVWIFVWLLVNAGSQFSPQFRTEAACNIARSAVEVAKTSPDGRHVEKVFPCVRVR